MSETVRTRASIADWFSLVRFSHSIFALPFALCGAWLAADGVPPLRTLALIVVCAVAARTAAMGFNRLVDRDVDALNARTRGREIPSGRLSVGAVTLLVVVACAVFVVASYALHRLAGHLSWPVLAIVLSYSLFKRFSWLAHIVLGVALALAPLGAWIAVRGSFDAALAPVLWLALAVTSWVAGFDLIYACQDAAFDEQAGLHSIPARFGVGFALKASSIAHVVTTIALVQVGVSASLGWIWFSAVGAAAVALIFEHRLVSKDDLSRVNAAFFTVNGWIGVGLFLGLALDRAFLG
ncbi:MAG: UbiA-like polyprenyltransferase [Planctomycetota bacterium]|nr:UbiA-like polyprenyltransferase [Planctomycetota bacterium]